jgi:hypothetical protein
MIRRIAVIGLAVAAVGVVTRAVLPEVHRYLRMREM